VIQAKHRKSPSPWKAMAEAEIAGTSHSDIPVAVVRRNGGDTLVCLRPEDFAYLLTGSAWPL
jgi:hypothetical protein